jgi:hypothetical protein
MFQFPGFAFVPYEFRYKYLLMISVSPKTCPIVSDSARRPKTFVRVNSLFGITEIEGGFPHSEIRGSKLVRSSPRLIAAYHVLHRLSAPRHPPNTLKALDRSHYRCPPQFLRIGSSENSKFSGLCDLRRISSQKSATFGDHAKQFAVIATAAHR